MPMPTTNLRKVGGSVMMAVPPAILEELELKAGATVTLAVEGDRLIVEPRRKPRFTLDELLAEQDLDAVETQEARAWLDSGPAGRELL
jgi:antitoxin ChpS